MANTKLTKKDYFTMIINGEITEEVKAFAEKELKALEDKAEKAKARDRKPSKEQLKRAAIKESAYLALTVGSTYSTEDLLETGAFEDMTKGQIASVMADYVNEGKAQRTVDHKKIKYTIL